MRKHIKSAISEALCEPTGGCFAPEEYFFPDNPDDCIDGVCWCAKQIDATTDRIMRIVQESQTPD